MKCLLGFREFRVLGFWGGGWGAALMLSWDFSIEKALSTLKGPCTQVVYTLAVTVVPI